MSDPSFLDAVVAALESARLSTEGGTEAAPIAVLWPDESGEWGPLIGQVAQRLPVLTLGAYDPASRKGPAYWVRCALDRAVPVSGLEDPLVAPVVYLPRVGRGQLRAIESAPAQLQPIAELQYRGTIFSQVNGRDMTILAFLQGGRGGLGLGVAADEATKDSMRRAAVALGAVSQSRLRAEAPLKASFFRSLLVPDIPRLVLEWLNEPQTFEAAHGAEGFAAFSEQLEQTYRIDPRVDGPIKAAEALGQSLDEAWLTAWQRFSESPARYPNIPNRLRAAKPPTDPKGIRLFDRPERWPQTNEEEESALRGALAGVSGKPLAELRSALATVEQLHSPRRRWVWARLGAAPLAMALEPLAALARLTSLRLSGSGLASMTSEYATSGWQVDDSAIRALALPLSIADADLVGMLVKRLYGEWLDLTCSAWQTHSIMDYAAHALPEWPANTCVLFSDGLRFDLGKRLEAALIGEGFIVELSPRLTAIPSITSTGKFFASPVASKMSAGEGFGVVMSESRVRVTSDVFRKSLASSGYQVLADNELGEPNGRAWTELGDIDSLGHDQTAKLPRLIDGEVTALKDRISALLAAGWGQVAVVTDHGWLYLPGGLPKVDLPQHLSQGGMSRKARCARLEDGATTSMQTFPWTWDKSVSVAIPPGSSAFQAGQVYEHGGLSPQECVTPLLTIRAAVGVSGPVAFTVRWRGLRADLQVANAPEKSTVDLRRKAGDRTSSLLALVVTVEQGAAKLLVRDRDNEGVAAFVVLLDASGAVIAQTTVTVGANP